MFRVHTNTEKCSRSCQERPSPKQNAMGQWRQKSNWCFVMCSLMMERKSHLADDFHSNIFGLMRHRYRRAVRLSTQRQKVLNVHFVPSEHLKLHYYYYIHLLMIIWMAGRRIFSSSFNRALPVLWKKECTLAHTHTHPHTQDDGERLTGRRRGKNLPAEDKLAIIHKFQPVDERGQSAAVFSGLCPQ